MRATRELDRTDWERFFEDSCARLPMSDVSIEVTSEGRRWMEADAMLLYSLAYDPRADVFAVIGARGGARSPQVLRHFVSAPSRILVDCPGSGPPSVVEVEDEDGGRTFVRIEVVPAMTG